MPYANAIDALRDVAAGKADKVHSHTKSEITDFPTSMPASDVSAWAKQPTKPSYNKSEVGLSNVDNVRQYSAENPPVLFQSEAPDDTSAIWVDFDDNYLDEFSDAVELALAQAKASGQFDGKDGTPGKNGDPGETPQRGVDYWTPADQEAIVQQVIDALGTPVFGRVDVDNNIILTGELTNGTYTLKYEGINGNVADIGSVTITDGNDVPETPQVINQLTISTDTDGSIFNGTGYKVGYRLSSSSAVTAVDVPAASNPVFVTGFIPVQQGQTIHLKDCYIDTDGINGSPSSTETKNYYGHATGSLNILICNSAKATQHVVNWGATKTSEHFTVTPDSDGIVTEITCNKAGMAYLRLVLAGDPTKAVITVE